MLKQKQFKEKAKFFFKKEKLFLLIREIRGHIQALIYGFPIEEGLNTCFRDVPCVHVHDFCLALVSNIDRWLQ